jgi:hypothetical protein
MDQRKQEASPIEIIFARVLVGAALWYVVQRTTRRPIPAILSAALGVVVHEAFDAPVARLLVKANL